MYTLFIVVSAVRASYHTVADNPGQVRPQLIAIIEPFWDAPDPLTFWDATEDRITDFLEEIDAEIDSEHRSAQQEDCPFGLCTLAAGDSDQAAAAEEVSETSAAPLVLALVVEPGELASAVEVEEERIASGSQEETAKEEVVEEEMSESAPAETLLIRSTPTLAQTVGRAKSLLDRPLASADKQLLADLQTVLAEFQSSKKLRENAKKTKTNVEMHIPKVDLAVRLIPLLLKYEQMVASIDAEMADTFGSKVREVVTGTDLQKVKGAVKRLEFLMKVDKTKFEQVDLPIGQVTDKAMSLFLEIVHLGAFDTATMPDLLFVPFSQLEKLVGAIQDEIQTLNDDLVKRPLTAAIGKGVDGQLLGDLEMLLADCIKLVDAHVADCRLYEPRHTPGQDPRFMMRIQAENIRYFRQTVHGNVASYEDTRKILDEANELFEQSLKELRDNYMDDRISNLSVLKYKLAAAYASLLTHPHLRTKADLRTEKAALILAGNAIDAINHTEGHIVAKPVLARLNSIAKVASHQKHSISELTNILKKVELLAFFGCALREEGRTAFVANLTKIKANLTKARQAASAGV